MHVNSMIRRSRKTGKKHRLNLAKSRVDRLSHRKFKNKKRPQAVKRKISRSVHKVFRTHKTTTGLRVRRRRF